jgi:tetratricopeptide (TPR) repeat protein
VCAFLVVLCAVVVRPAAQTAAQAADELFARAKALIEENAGEGDRAEYAQGAKLMRQAIAAGCSDQATAYKILAGAMLSLEVDIPWDSPDRRAAERDVDELYRRAIALDPSDMETRWEYSGTLRDPSASRRALEEILQIDPRYGLALQSYGELLIEQGDVETGLRKWHESVEFETNPVLLEYSGLALAETLESLGRAGEAEAARQLMHARLNEPVALRLLTGDNQQGRLGATVNRLAVEVWTFGGEYAPGQTVTFAVTGGSGSLSITRAVTGEDGIAATILTLGDTPGLVTVEARWRDQKVLFRIEAVE